MLLLAKFPEAGEVLNFHLQLQLIMGPTITYRLRGSDDLSGGSIGRLGNI